MKKSVTLVKNNNKMNVLLEGEVSIDEEVVWYVSRIEGLIKEECIMNNENKKELLNKLETFYQLWNKF